MDTVSAREGLRGDHGVRNVRSTSTAEGEGVTSGTAVVFALPPGVTVTHVEVDGVDATAEAVGEGAWSVGAHLAPGSRHRVQVRYQGRLDMVSHASGGYGGRPSDGGCSISLAASMATNRSILRARVSGRLAS